MKNNDLHCGLCHKNVAFKHTMCDDCAKNYSKYMLLNKVEEACYTVIEDIRLGEGMYAPLDQQHREIMCSGAEKCIIEVMKIRENLRGKR
jgi:hypothetical protein